MAVRSMWAEGSRMFAHRGLRRRVAEVVVATLGLTATSLLVATSPVVAAPGDQIAPVTAVGSGFVQSFARSDLTVNEGYVPANGTSGSVTQDATTATAAMNSKGTAVTYSPTGVATSTGAVIDVAPTSTCVGGATLTDCGTAGSVKLLFDTPVSNPTLHIAGIGALQNSTIFSSYYTVSASTSSTDAANSAAWGAVYAGATNLQVSGGRLQAATTKPNTSCDSTGTAGANGPAGCGSVQLTGTNLTSVTLTVGLTAIGGTVTPGASVNDQVVLTTSIPDVTPATGSFTCAPNAIYAVHQDTYDIMNVDVGTGAEKFFGRFNLPAGTPLNALAITDGGGAAYAAVRAATGGGATTIYRYDTATGTTTKFTGPTLSQTSGGVSIVEGAIDPANDIYYMAFTTAASGIEIYGFDTTTNTPITGRIAHLPGYSGANGDMTFDSLGRLILTASAGGGTATDNPLIYITQPLGSTGADTVLPASVVGYLQPSTATVNGMAFDFGQGYLYTNTNTGGIDVVHQVNPSSGADVKTNNVTYLGQTTSQVVDLASCVYNNSIQVQKNIVSRFAAGDQFTVQLSGGGLNSTLSGTTSGTSAGLQTSTASTAGPAPAVYGATYSIKEVAGNAQTALSNYITSWSCVDLLNPDTVLFSGTGTSGTVGPFPAATSAAGLPLGCTFKNDAINSSIAILKTTDKAAYRSGETVTYTIKVTNTGNSTLTGTAVTDPSNTSCAKTVGSLGAGASTSYTCTATAPVTNNQNVATVSATDPLNKTVTATSTVAVPVIAPKLTLTKTASPTTVTSLGQTITYTFGVTNSGDSTVNSIAIADTPVSPAGAPAAITCLATTLAAGASTICTGTYAATQADLDKGTIADSAVANGKDIVGGAVASNTASASVTVTRSPQLTLAKTATPTTVASVGATVSYAFTVTNTGNVTVSGITVADLFDNAGVTPPTITCPATTLAPGASTRCTASYTATQSDFDQGSINNTATANGTAAGGAAVASNPSSASVTATTSATLSVVKTATPTTVTAAGQTVTYGFKVTNTGNQTLTGVAIADTFTAPAGPALAPITCLATTLAPGANTTCTATYTVTQADVDKGRIDNGATASAKNPKGTTVTSAQSNATVSVTQTPKLSLAKTASPTTITGAGTGNKVTYSFLVGNTGNVTVTNLAIADTFAGPAGPALTITCPVTQLAPGANTTCTASYTPTQADVDNGSIKNSATATGTDPGNNPVTSPISSATVTVTRTSSLNLAKSAAPTTVSAVNATVAYSFVVTNTGNQTLTGLSVDDSLTSPANPPLTITCPSTTLTPGASTTCTATYKTTQADLDNGTINNTATASAKDPTNAAITSNASTATVTAATTPALTLTKSASPTTVTAANQTVNYTFSVTNSGNATISALAITDPMFTGAAAPVCLATTLAPGATTTCTASYKTTQADVDAGKIVNTATAAGKNPKGGTVTSNTSTATVTATQNPALTVAKSASPSAVRNAGDKITYSFVVTNTGNVSVTGLTVNDVFTAPAGPVPAITCPVTSLAPNASTTCTSAQYAATQADINNGTITNSATATGKGPTNASVTSPSSTATVTAAASTSLSLTKTAAPTTVTAAGQKVTYTFAVTNNSNVTVTGVAIADTFTAPAAPALSPITCAATTLAPAAGTTCTATYTATQADVDAGSIKNSATASAADPGNRTITSNTASATVTIPPASSLTVAKTASPTTITAAGTVITYSFAVTNTGNTTLTNVTVADVFSAPAGPPITPTCPGGSLAPGAKVTCTATYVSTQADVDAGSIKNSASATAKDPAGTGVTSPTVSATVTATRTDGLTVTKAASPAAVSTVGQQISYTFTARNTGNTTLSLLSVTDTLTAPASPAPAVTCPTQTIAPGSTVVCTASYTVTQADLDAGSVGNSATANAQDPAGTAVTSPPSTTSVPAITSSSLSVVKSAAPTTVTAAGQTVTYTFAVKNTGTVTIHGIAVADTFTAPAGPALNPIACTSTTLAPAASTTCTASYTVTQADVNNGSISNSATITGLNPVNTAVTSAPSTATVTATAAPGLSLVKSASPTTVTAAGQVVTYTFVVKNTGNVDVSAVAVSDNRLAAAPTCTPTSLAPGATSTCTGTYTSTQADVDAGKIVNTATASGRAPGNATVTSPAATATVTATANPTLTITKGASPTTVTAAGATVTYSFTMKNTGNVTVHGVNVVDRFTAPAGPPLAPITCQATTLAPAATTNCTATYTVTQADIDNGSIANAATAAGLDPSNAAVGSAPASATVTATRSPALTVTKTANPSTATRAGQTINYGFAVTNTGNVTLTTLSIADTFAAPVGPPLGAISCLATTLAPAASTSCSAAYTVTQADVDAGVISNSATAGANDPTGRTVTSGPSTATVTIAPGPALALTKSVSPTTYSAPNATLTYTFTVTNTGTVTIRNVAVADPFFTGVRAPVCTSTTLAPNASTTCTASLKTTQADVDAGSIVNTATASGTTPGGAAVGSPSASATATATQTPSIKLVKSANPQTVTTVGQSVAYTFAVTNTGNVDVTGLYVTDTFAAPATPTGDIICADNSIAPGDTQTCTFTYPSTQADFDKGQIANTAVAHATAPGNRTVDSAPSSAIVTASQAAGLTVTKSVSPTTVTTVGQTVTDTFAVTNNGTVTISAVSIVDTQSAPAGALATGPTCVRTSLTAGQSTTCTATYRVTQADLDNGSITDSAVAKGTDPSSTAVTSPPSSATVGTSVTSSLGIVKSATPTTVSAVGTPVAYTFTVTNTGTSTIRNVTVNDPRFGTNGVSCAGGAPTLAPGASVLCTASYAVTQADLDAGTIVNTATAAGTDPRGAAVTSGPSTATVTATQRPALSVLKTATTTGVSRVGDTVAYTIKITNTGNVTLTKTQVSDTLGPPAAPALVLSCPAAAPLAPAASITCTATYPATQADLDNGSISNTAAATAAAPDGSTVTAPPSTAVVPTSATSALSLVKSVSPTTQTVGNQVVYSFLVTNTGAITVNGIGITDTFTAPATPALTIRCPQTSLAPGASTTCTGTYTVKQADADRGRIDNSATASGTDATGKAVSSPASTATVTIPQVSSLGIVKSASPAGVSAVGQVVSYTFVVTNTGTTTITGAAVLDTQTPPAGALAAAPTCPAAAASLAPNAAVTCTASYTVTQADVDNGSVNDSAVATGTDPSGTKVTSAPSTASVPVSSTSAISLVKSASPGTVTRPGQTVSYSFLVTNNGTTTLKNLAVADTLQAPAGALAAGPSCPVTTLAPAASTTCTATYVTTQADIDNGSIANSATASATQPNGRSLTSTPSTATVTATRSPGLSLTKSAAPATVTAPGQAVTYTFAVKNTGNVSLTALAISDAFDAPAGPPLSAISCLATALAPNAATTCTATYLPTQADIDAGSITNSASATAAAPGGATVTSNPSTAVVSATRTAALGLVKTADPTTVTGAGRTVRYTFKVTNTGNTTLNAVAVTDTFTAPAGPDPSVSCPSGPLTPGASVTCTATYVTTQADADKGTIDNSAVATAAGPTGSTVTSPTATAEVTIPAAPSLAVVKSANLSSIDTVGQLVTYTFRVTNTGNQTVSGIGVSDRFTAPAGPEVTPSCPVTTLLPGASTDCTAAYPATQADIDNGSVTDTARAAGTDPANRPVTSAPSTVTVPVNQTSALALVKSATVTDVDGDGRTDLGDTIAYSFTVTNNGNRSLSTIGITDATAGPITCRTTTLGAGASTTCTATTAHTVTQADVDAGRVDNTATAAGKDSSGTTVTSPPASVSTPVASTSSISLLKSATPSTVTAAGQTVSYSFAVTNTGTTTVTGLAVADTLDAPAGPALTVVCPTTPLRPGATATCRASYPVTQADVDNGSISNAATATGIDPSGTPLTSNRSTATVTATPAPALVVRKTADPSTLTAAGQTVTYTFAVQNSGNVTLTNLSIADTFTAPAGPAADPVCGTTALAPGAKTTCTTSYVATQDDVDAGAIRNSAIANATGPGAAAVSSVPSAATVTILPTPALDLVKSASPALVSGAGQTITYRFAVTNVGNVTVAGIAITDTLSAPAGPQLSDLTCPDTTLAPGASTTCTGSYDVTQDDIDHGVVTNAATASGRTPGGATVTSPSSTATVPASSRPLLTLVKSADPTTVSAPGQTVTYTFAVTNSGNLTVRRLAIADMLNAPAGPALTVTCPTTALSPDATAVCSASYLVTQADIDNGSIKNTATASGVDPNGRSVASLPSSATVAASQTSTLTLVKSAEPGSVAAAGDVVTYSFAVTNAGNTTITGIVVTDNFAAPAGPAAAVACPTSTVAPGATVTCTASYTATQADVDNGTIANAATVTGSTPGGGNVTAGPSNAVVTAAPAASLSLVKSASPTTVTAAGDQVTYSFLATNTGNVTLTGLAVTDGFTAPAGQNLPVTCPAAALAPGDQATCTGTYTATQADIDRGTITNTATATAGTPAGRTVTSPPSSAKVTATPAPVLTVTKSADPTTVSAAGDRIGYRFVVVNTGNVTVRNVAVTDTLTAPAGPALTVSCPGDPLTPGSRVTCTATYVATQADIDNGSISNSAVASATPPGGGSVTSDPSTATVTAAPAPGLTLVKSASPSSVTAAGDKVTYSFLLTNTGNVTLSGLAVSDTLAAPAGPALDIDCPTDTLAPGLAETCTARYTARQVDIDTGTISNSAVAAGRGPDGTSITSSPSTAVVTAAPAPELRLVKQASPTTVTAAGQIVTYTFTATNTGNVTITGLTVADTFSAPAGPAIAVDCPNQTVTPGASVVCTATYAATQADVNHGSIANSATASGSLPGGTTVTSAPATAVVGHQHPRLARARQDRRPDRGGRGR